MQKVTIVIPCYKQAQYLPDAIESALAQSVPLEVIVVSDNSPDNTVEVAKKYGVRVIEKENGGLSSARNAGIKAATSEWILPLDADDKIAPDFVEKLLAKAEAENLDIVGGSQQEFGDKTGFSIFNDYPTHFDFVRNNQINCCSMFKKEMWEKIGGYDEKMKLGYEDWDFWLRATRIGYKVGTVTDAIFFYRKHGQSMIDETVKHHHAIREYMLKKL